jgi:hypothetical protein
MGIFDFLSSSKKPKPGTQVCSPEEVLNKLLSLNRSSAPFRIIDGKAEKVDLIVEWKIMDEEWHKIFADAEVKKVFKIYLKLNPAEHQVRAMDREYTVEWEADAPSLSISVSSFKGQSQSIEFGKAYAFSEELGPGKVYKYRFDTRELKGPIQETVTGCGWTYKGVAFGKL